MPIGARDVFFDSVKAMERQTAGVQLISRFARSTARREEVMLEALKRVAELVGADAGAIVLANEATGFFDFVAAHWGSVSEATAVAKEKALQLFRVKLDQGIIGQVYQTREPVILPDVAKNQSFRKDIAEAIAYDIQNLLAVPIQTEDARWGVLELFNKGPRGTFSAKDMELGVVLGAQIATVLEVLRLRSAERPAVLTPPPPPPPTPPPPPPLPAAAPPVASTELQDTRRTARDAQAQLKETRSLLEAALDVQDQNKKRIAALTEDLERAKALAEAATPAQQVAKMLRAVEPIAFALSVETVLKNFSEMAGRLVNAQAVQVFLWEEREERFRLAYCTAPSGLGQAVSVSFRMGEGLAGFSAERMELVQAEDVTKDDHFSKTIDEVPGVLSRTVIAGPLAANGRLVGVLEALNRKDGRPFTAEDGVALAGLALLGAAALEKAIAHEHLGETARAALAAVADTIETRSAEGGGGRADRIRRMAVALGEALGMKPKDVGDLEWASLLYNAGKITIPPEVAVSRGDLLPKDRELLLNVPRVSADRLETIPLLGAAARIIRHVNERWDGMGVPDRQAGEDIPLGSRVLAAVDAFEGLVAGGPGAKAVPADVAMKEMETCAGKQFDPACVESLLRLLRSPKWRAAG